MPFRQPCYYDGSTLNADAPYQVLLTRGEDALWAYLEEYFHDQFESDNK